jgi:hypothetical protein
VVAGRGSEDREPPHSVALADSRHICPLGLQQCSHERIMEPQRPSHNRGVALPVGGRGIVTRESVGCRATLRETLTPLDRRLE